MSAIEELRTRDKSEQMGLTDVLSARDEREIVWRCVFISQSQRDVADEFGISQSTVSRVMSHYKAENTGELERRILDEFDGVVEPYK